MKRLIHLLLLLLPVLGQAQPMTFSKMNIALQSVSYGSDDKIVAVSPFSTIYTSEDGGETWTGRKCPVQANFTSVHMVDANTGWVVGSGGVIVKTTNGGITWVPQTSGVTVELKGVFAVSANVAYACGGGGSAPANPTILIRTVDGGATWNPVWTTPPTGTQGFNTSGTTLYNTSLNSVYFVDANNGYAAGGLGSVPIANGGGGKILKTTDGGATWSVATMPSTNFSFRSVYFPTDSAGFACGNSQNSTTPNNFWKTTDGGATWTNPNSVNLTLQTVRAFDANGVVVSTGAGSNSIVRRSFDGGTTWVNDTVNTTASTLAGLDVRGGFIIATGGQGLIYKRSSSGWAQKNGGQAFNAWDGFFMDANTGWVACDGGRVMKTTDSGTTWTTQQTTTSNSLQSVWFKNSMEGFAVGSLTSSPTMVKTTDGGTTWATQALPSGTIGQHDVFFVDGSSGWTVGNSGTINHTTDGGATWTAQTSGLTTTITAVHFIDALNGWACGLSGKIIRTTDGGTTWTLQTLPAAATTTLYDIWFANANVGYTCGASGKAYKTIDGGSTWTELTTGTTFFLNDLEFFDANRGILAGTSGTMLFTADGGATFTPAFPPLTSLIISAVWQARDASVTNLFFAHTSPTNAGFNIVKSSLTEYFPDADGDTFGSTAGVGLFVENIPSGYSTTNTDCDDNNAAVNPAATEVCNTIDDDCDTQIDEGLTSTFYADADGDSYGDAATTQAACTAPTGFVSNDDDCNDTDAAINPAATEVCFNMTDENCDGQVNEGCAPLGIGYTLTASCTLTSGNSITVSALGGVAPFQYSKNGGATFQSSPTFNGLTPGTYNLVVKDATSLTASLSATVNGTMALSTSVVLPLCAGGTGEVSVAVSGGYPGYSYNWTKSGQPFGGNTATLTDAPAGSYKVTVTDDKGCTKVASRVLGQPTGISVSGTKTNVSCNGGDNGSINLTSAGGTGTRTYLWNDGATTEDRTGLVAGQYTCTVTDANGCTRVSATFNITQPSAITVNISKTDVACFGGSNGKLKASASGGAGAKTYSWSNGGNTQEITNLAAGTYTVTATDASGCTKVGSATIAQPASAVAITNVVSAPSGSNYRVTVTATGGTPNYKYKRSVGGGAYSGENGNGIFTNVPAGTYEFVVRDTKNCTDTITATIPVPPFQPATSDDRGHQQPETLDLNIFPNPASDVLTVMFANQSPLNGSLVVADVFGRVVMEQHVSVSVGERKTLSLDRLAAGNYTLKFVAADNSFAIKSFILVR
ncbi:MAG: YCF48-related protein [Saprospiraceae bacterium]